MTRPRIFLCYGGESLAAARAILAERPGGEVLVLWFGGRETPTIDGARVVSFPVDGVRRYWKALRLFRRAVSDEPLLSAASAELYLPHPVHFAGNFFFHARPGWIRKRLTDGLLDRMDRRVEDLSRLDLLARRVLGLLAGVPYRPFRTGHLSQGRSAGYEETFVFDAAGLRDAAGRIVVLKRPVPVVPSPPATSSGILFLDQEIEEVFGRAAAALRRSALGFLLQAGQPVFYKAHPRGRNRIETLRLAGLDVREAPSGAAEDVAVRLGVSRVVSYYSSALLRIAQEGLAREAVALFPKAAPAVLQPAREALRAAGVQIHAFAPRPRTIFTAGRVGFTDGASRAAADFTRALMTCSDVLLISDDIERTVEAELRAMPGVSVYVRFPDLRKPGRKRRALGWLRSVLYRDGARWIMSRMMSRSFWPDLVLVNEATDSVSRAVMRQVKGRTRLLAAMHVSPRHYIDRGTLLSDLVATLREAAGFVFVAGRVADEWKGLYPEVFAAGACHVVPNVADERLAARLRLESRSALRQSLGLPEGRLITCVASVQPRKGQDVLVAAFESIAAARPDVVLALVGPNGGDWARSIATAIAASPVRDRIIVTGPRTDAMAFLRAADVCAVPSRAEALPLVLMEAWAVGTPVVASAVDGIPEAASGQAALLVPPEDSETLAAALARVLDDPIFARHLAASGTRRLETRYSRAAQARAFTALVADETGVPSS